MKTKEIQLTAKEAYILWSVICWWNKENQRKKEPKVTHKLKVKLFNVMTDEQRYRFQNKYENWEQARIVEIGLWIKEKHPEWLE